MSKVAKDVKAGLNGIRGDTMQAADELLDQDPDDPQAQASETKSQAIMENGKQQLASADDTVGHRHGTRSKTAAAARAREGAGGTAAPPDVGDY
ncbi:hypothetical protein F5883DRAFT_548809, partial [Diaporthe sp. PMI_573]